MAKRPKTIREKHTEVDEWKVEMGVNLKKKLKKVLFLQDAVGNIMTTISKQLIVG